jgi:hypothetical protein
MLKLSRSVIVVIVALAALVTPVPALADPAPPLPPAKPVHQDLHITKLIDVSSPNLFL